MAHVDSAISFRDAIDSDAAPLADLLTQLGYPVEADRVRQRLAYWLSDAMSRVLVAERGGRVVGCMSVHAIPYFERTGRWLRIESLVVDAAERGTGAGRAMVEVAEDIARRWDCVAVEVTSLRAREGAHAFYRRLGYVDLSDSSARFFKELA